MEKVKKRDPLRERRELKSLLRAMPRSPLQRSGFFESDAEILRWDSSHDLVATTDALAEEIAIGLYRDPFTWGWLCVMNSVSDLAATGADGLGVLLSCEWGSLAAAKKKRFMTGARAALKASGLPLLGGDSGSGPPCFTSTALGKTSGRALSRKGAKPGDRLLLIGRRRTGVGPALAERFLAKLADGAFPERLFRPRPQSRLIAKLRAHVKASIDSSDGLAIAVATLAEINGVGFALNWKPETLHPRAAAFMKKRKLPPELLWMGDLGDLQTLLVVSKAKATALLKKHPELIDLGEVTRARRITLEGRDLKTAIALMTEAARTTPEIRHRRKKLARFFALTIRSTER